MTGGSSSALTERLLRQNAELTGFVSRLTEEKNELRNQLLRLEEELRRQRHLSAHSVSTAALYRTLYTCRCIKGCVHLTVVKIKTSCTRDAGQLPGWSKSGQAVAYSRHTGICMLSEVRLSAEQLYLLTSVLSLHYQAVSLQSFGALFIS